MECPADEFAVGLTAAGGASDLALTLVPFASCTVGAFGAAGCFAAPVALPSDVVAWLCEADGVSTFGTVGFAPGEDDEPRAVEASGLTCGTEVWPCVGDDASGVLDPVGLVPGDDDSPCVVPGVFVM
jgi:hypothetical protein